MGYEHGAGQTLRIAVIDETGGTDWSPSINAAMRTYGSATRHLVFQTQADGANIVIRFHRYSDANPPAVRNYVFIPGVGGFAAVYDADGVACNFPPSTLPVGCSGELRESIIYLNDAIPPGHDIEARRERLLLHELGHAMGLERHGPDLDIARLQARYGWD